MKQSKGNEREKQWRNWKKDESWGARKAAENSKVVIE
jgi:hypothetical protein